MSEDKSCRPPVAICFPQSKRSLRDYFYQTESAYGTAESHKLHWIHLSKITHFLITKDHANKLHV